MELKENKKECLIEIIDVLDESEAVDTIINEKTLAEAIKMISANLFRTFSNKGKLLFKLNPKLIPNSQQKIILR